MLEFLIGFFILGSLSLALREEREKQCADNPTEPYDKDYHFDESVYVPHTLIEEEYVRQKTALSPITLHQDDGERQVSLPALLQSFEENEASAESALKRA